MSKQKLVLDLDALTEAPQVRIDGQLYDLRTKGEFSPLDAHRFKKLGGRMDALVSKEDLSDAEESELEGITARICRDVIDAPEDVLAKLRDSQRMRIISTFVETLSETSQPAAVETPAAEKTTAE